ncbi:hypothetical protein [uncultured Thalassospira sp.]|uniref:hypothetical protein n=1 Tax=uncultured Thalassospira sp. TaxID=404382 RepID=UPI0030D79CF1|tara:strand:- start:1501 stop:2625 length:1125 start_codon:yes stop_codon:yes gene_type:complete
MTYDEILDLFSAPNRHQLFNTQEDLDTSLLDKVDNYIVIGDCGVFPVFGVKSSIDRGDVLIDVSMSDGCDLGSLIFTKGRIVGEFSLLSLQEFFAYLVDVPSSEFAKEEYTISKDYFITSPNLADKYIKCFYKSAPIWGGYTHYAAPEIIEAKVRVVTAIEGIVTPSDYHVEAFSRYIHALNPLERYLRLYHCIELLFDAITVLRIKKLSNDIRELSEILSDHETTEMGRLLTISKKFIYNSEGLASSFRALSSHEVMAEKIFQNHSKKGNPIPPDGDAKKWRNLIDALKADNFTEGEWRAVKFLGAKDNYSLMVAKLASYWIYRVRCSIAHSRIGEYILEDQDQQFVIDFAEPMLLEFCNQIFTSQELNDLLI